MLNNPKDEKEALLRLLRARGAEQSAALRIDPAANPNPNPNLYPNPNPNLYPNPNRGSGVVVHVLKERRQRHAPVGAP